MLTFVTLASRGRVERVAQQHEAILRYAPGARHGMVALSADTRVPHGLESIAYLDGMELAAARNLAGDWAAQWPDPIIFLDADCLPGEELAARYAEGLRQHPEAVLSGPVTYLPSSEPHPARPNPPAGAYPLASADEYALFWSLSFAVLPAVWQACRANFGGFDESFTGYGGEDTDFAFSLRAQRIPMRWCGGAHAFHQWHPVSSPPWEHLSDIVVNANRFHAKWGVFPMEGWLAEFERAGAIALIDGTWELT